jgi:hypothetical protein
MAEGTSITTGERGLCNNTYAYNPDGARMRKTVGGTRTDIFVNDSGMIHGQKM